jgi:hypothetical protein
MSQSSHTNRRHFVRIPSDHAARLIAGKESWSCQVLDLSLKGALLQSRQPFSLPLGSACRLEVMLDREVKMAMEVTISHCHGDTIGVVSQHIDLESISHLRRFVELNLGDSALLQRELSELLARPADPDG